MNTTAIIPVAGLGTRFLPITRVVSKELLPVLTKPVLQYVFEELADAGIRNVVMVTREGKDDIRQYCNCFEGDYDRSVLTENSPLAKTLDLLSKFSIKWVLQEAPRGLGHAILCAEDMVEDDWIVVALPDVIVDSGVGCSRQMLLAHDQQGSPLVATHREEAHLLSFSGILDVETQRSNNLLKIRKIVEKPAKGLAPSSWVVSGRYLLPREIFSILRDVRPDARSEIQLTDALNILCSSREVDGFVFDGHQMDTGNVKGWLSANQYFAKK